MAALKDALRGDEGGCPSLTPVAIAAPTLQYPDHPGWTARLHPDNLRVTLQTLSLVCAVANTRWAVSEVWIAICLVSRRRKN